MRGSFKMVALAAVAVVTVGVTPSGAFHEDALPVVEQLTGQGNGWRAYKVTTNGSHHAIDVETTNTGGAGQAGAYFYNANGSFAGGFVFTAFGAKNGALVRIPDVNVNVDTTTTQGGGMAVGLGVNDPDFPPPFVGTRHYVLWWAGQAGPTWKITFRGQPGTTIDAVASGDDAWLVQSNDFASSAQVEAYRQSAGARASVEATYDVAVADTLIGMYQMGLASGGQMSVATPSGERGCSLSPVIVPLVTGGICLFADMQGPNRNGPGAYQMRTTSAGAGFAGAFDDVWFGGADARLAS